MEIPIGLMVGGLGFLHRTASRMWACTLRAFVLMASITLIVGVIGLAVGWSAAGRDGWNPDDWTIPDGLDEPGRFLVVEFMHSFNCLGGVVELLGGVVAKFMQRRKDKPSVEA